MLYANAYCPTLVFWTASVADCHTNPAALGKLSSLSDEGWDVGQPSVEEHG